MIPHPGYALEGLAVLEGAINMDVKVISGRVSDCAAAVIVVPLFANSDAKALLNDLDELSGNLFSSIVAAMPQLVKSDECTVLPFADKRVLLYGMGDDVNSRAGIRAQCGNIGRKLRAMNTGSVAVMLNCFERNTIAAAIEGLILGNYQFDTYLSEKHTALAHLELIIEDPEGCAVIVDEAVIKASSVNAAREWINTPAMICTPAHFARIAEEIAHEHGLECDILNRIHMQEHNLQGLLAVSKGSSEAPRMVVLKYQGASQCADWTAYVGKGVTFDSGGLSLKPAPAQITMKSDMSGAAIVLAALRAIARLRLSANIMAILPLCENMPSGDAYRPGDILPMANGKTVEIHSTDAEGRLILADAVHYAHKAGAARIIDIATLTGACARALGKITTGLVDNNSEWCYQVIAAAAAADERVWRFPNYSEYKELLKSPYADYKNSAEAGAITGGLFIGEFVENTPWVHVDIAGMAWNDKAVGINPAGASGVMIRTLIELAK